MTHVKRVRGEPGGEMVVGGVIPRALSALCIAGVVQGCATRPDVETSTGANAFQIAQAVRCEMRDAIIAAIARAFRESGDPLLAEQLAERDFTSEKAAEREAERFSILLERAAQADATARKQKREDERSSALARYSGAAVAYDFELNLKQTDNLGGSVDLLSTLSRGTIKATPSASLEGKREATRNFRIVDNFGQLLTNLPTIEVCNQLRQDAPNLRRPNAVYPIAGTLGLARLLGDFLSLNQSANLVGGLLTPDIPTMAETIEFTTTIKAGIEPVLKLEPLNNDLEVTGAGLTLKTERYDRHKLVVTFSLPSTKKTVAQQRSDTARAAIDELDNQRNRENDSATNEFLRAIGRAF